MKIIILIVSVTIFLGDQIIKNTRTLLLTLTLFVISAGTILGADTVPANSPANTTVTRYTVTDLGTLGGGSMVEDINNSGQAVGYSYSAGGILHAVLFSNGTVTDLGTLGGTYSKVMSINDSGQAAGSSFGPGDAYEHAALFSKGTVTDLGSLGYTSWGYDINNSGQVVGTADYGGDDWHAALFSNGIVTDLGTLGGRTSDARSINDFGQAVGYAFTPLGDRHAALYSNGNVTDLGTLGGANSYALSINNSGQAVGDAETVNGIPHAALFSNGKVVDLGTLGDYGSGALSINNSGQVVGYSYLGNSFGVSAVIFINGNVIDLNSLVDAVPPGFGLADAQGINDFGQIVCNGSMNGQSRAFLLTPVPNQNNFTFTGFFAPVDNNSVFNTSKAGQTIPVKWQITDSTGVSISDPSSFVSLTSFATDCTNPSSGSSSGSNDIIEVVTPGNSGLEYLGDGNWQLNWKTSRNYSEPGQECRRMVLKLKDGSIHAANFKFTK